MDRTYDASANERRKNRRIREQQKVIDALKDKPMTASDIAKLVEESWNERWGGMTPKSVGNRLGELRRQGRVKRIGRPGGGTSREAQPQWAIVPGRAYANRSYKVRITTPADTIASQPDLRSIIDKTPIRLRPETNVRTVEEIIPSKKIINSKEWVHHNDAGDPLWGLYEDGELVNVVNIDETDDDAFRDYEDAVFMTKSLDDSVNDFWSWDGYGSDSEYSDGEYIEHMPTGIRIYRNEFTSKKDVIKLIKERNDNKQWMSNRDYDFRITSSAEPSEILEVISPNDSYPGFDFDGVRITNPMFDEAGISVVNPYEYYGKEYEDWLAKFDGGVAPGLPGDDAITQRMRDIEGWDEVNNTLYGVIADIGYVPDAIQNARNTYRDNEDINYHTENNLMVAQLFGDEAMIARMNDILDRSFRSGMGVGMVDREWMNENVLPLHRRLFEWRSGDAINLPPSRTISQMENTVFNVVDNQQDADDNSVLRGTILDNDPTISAWGIDIQPFQKDDFKELVWDEWPLYFETDGEQYVKRSYDGLTQQIQYVQSKVGEDRGFKIKSFDPFSDSDKNKLDAFERIYFKSKPRTNLITTQKPTNLGASSVRFIDKSMWRRWDQFPRQNTTKAEASMSKQKANQVASNIRKQKAGGGVHQARVVGPFANGRYAVYEKPRGINISSSQYNNMMRRVNMRKK
mgnify:CR=1 FL=1|tara:strand:+ start:24851 stop:26911 length:2061 start_codon:yes stop_codon:yes gene_type:complete